MAVSKSASKKSAARKAAKKVVKKAAKPRKPPAKKVAVARKKRVAVKKAVVTRKSRATTSPATAELDNRIAILRNNLRDLVEQATGHAGAANEELMSQRIADHEAKLADLIKQREALSK